MYICKNLKLRYYLFFLLILIGLTSCALTGVPGSLSEAQRNACMAPSANFQALDSIHSTKIHKILWVKKYAKQTVTKKLSLSDKCRQTQILIQALYGLDDGESVSWENNKNQTSGKIKMLRTHVSRGAWGYGGCRDYLAFIVIENKLQTYKFRACPHELNHFELPDSRGFAIPGHLLFAGWYFYDSRFFK